MKTVQYTIRAVPENIDGFLRRQAKLRGKSLNQTVLDYITQATKVDLQQTEDDYAWIIGANTMDSDSIRAITELKAIDKRLAQIERQNER